MDNKELTPIQKLMLSIETTPEICFPIEINFNDGQEILEALQSQNTYNPECKWVYDEDMEMWETDCNTAFHFIEGGFEENSANFCHKCGGKIKAITSKGE